MIKKLTSINILTFKPYNVLHSHMVSYGTPMNLNWFWSFGSMAGMILVSQMISGFFLGCHYVSHMEYAFETMTEMMTEMPNGYFLRYLHSNGASVFFIMVYAHMAKALFYGGYFKPSHMLWIIGVVIFILMMATAFMGYVLPWGQMSLWGATVITSLFSAIPKVGIHILRFIWGGFSVENPTLERFFALHFFLPFMIAAFAGIHLLVLHACGSNSPTGTPPVGLIAFLPSFGIKDVAGFFVAVLLLILLLAIHPNALGHPDNDIPALMYTTPKHIVPEWYFLPFYAILRSIPHKLGGVIAMFGSIVILFFLPYMNLSEIRSSFFRPIYSFCLFIFFINVFFLGWIGHLPADSPYIDYGWIGTLYYFVFFIFILPISAFVEQRMAYYNNPDVQKWRNIEWINKPKIFE